MVRTGATVLLASLLAWPAGAQELGRDAIVDRLAPKKPLTRGIGAPGAQPRTRQIVIEPGQEGKVLAAVKEEKLPSLDIRVPFDYNSDVLTREAQAVLKPLGEALKDPKLAKARFLIGGHTDAKGSDDYNQSLSERRARSVQAHLVAAFSIDPSRVRPMGFGERSLADPARPEDGVNRRVEIVNLGG